MYLVEVILPFLPIGIYFQLIFELAAIPYIPYAPQLECGSLQTFLIDTSAQSAQCAYVTYTS